MIVPLALATLVTGVVVSVVSSWALWRHFWVVISLVLTAFAVVVTVVHMPTVCMMADAAREVGPVDLRSLGGDLFHPGVGIVVLLVIMALKCVQASRSHPLLAPRPGRAGDARPVDPASSTLLISALSFHPGATISSSPR